MPKPSITVLMLSGGVLLTAWLVVACADARPSRSGGDYSNGAGGRHRRREGTSREAASTVRRWCRAGIRACWSYRVAGQHATEPTGPARLEAFGSRACARV